MRSKTEAMAGLRRMLHDMLTAREGGRAPRLARVKGCVDGAMRALLDSGQATRKELLDLVAAERARVSGPATGGDRRGVAWAPDGAAAPITAAGSSCSPAKSQQAPLTPAAPSPPGEPPSPAEPPLPAVPPVNAHLRGRRARRDLVGDAHARGRLGRRRRGRHRRPHRPCHPCNPRASRP